MSEAIQVLVDLASNATLDNQENITTMLADADISEGQKKAIVTKCVKNLENGIYELPEIKCFPLIPAEDDEEQSEDEKEQEGDNSTNILVAAVNI